MQEKELIQEQSKQVEKIGLSEIFKSQLIPGHIQILENLYINYRVVSYKQIWNVFKKTIKISDRTLRKRIKELEELGLIDCIKSYELLLSPKKELREEVLKEIQNYRTRLMMQ
ncbi:MAG: hypothetical protein V1859_02575 [archaeon]